MDASTAQPFSMAQEMLFDPSGRKRFLVESVVRETPRKGVGWPLNVTLSL